MSTVSNIQADLWIEDILNQHLALGLTKVDMRFMIEGVGGCMGEPEQAAIIYQAHMAFTQQRIDYWVQNNLFTWQWWFLVVILILPWFLWWKVVDKKRILSILSMGLVVIGTANWMDQVGNELGWWYYPYRILPFVSQFGPVNYSSMPISYMLLYQIYPRWSAFLVAAVITAAVFTWVIEPLFIWLGMYHVVFWKSSYSFLIYILIAISHKGLVDLLTVIVGKSKSE